MPELPEVQAHAERLSEEFAGRVLVKFVPLTFTALKTALPAPDEAYGTPLRSVGRRGKYLLLHFDPVTFVVHLMQGGRLLVDEKQSAKPRGGQARFVFTEPDGATRRRCCSPRPAPNGAPACGACGPATRSRRRRSTSSDRRRTSSAPSSWSSCSRAKSHAPPRIPPRPAIDRRHRPPARQRGLPPGQALAVRDRRRSSGIDGARAVVAAIARDGRRRARVRAHTTRHELVEGSTRARARPGGEPCPVCGDTIRAVEYAGTRSPTARRARPAARSSPTTRRSSS